MHTRSDAMASLERFTTRLRPAPAFSEAAASIQAALDELRRAECALERQIADLRAYRRGVRVEPATTPTRSAA